MAGVDPIGAEGSKKKNPIIEEFYKNFNPNKRTAFFNNKVESRPQDKKPSAFVASASLMQPNSVFDGYNNNSSASA